MKGDETNVHEDRVCDDEVQDGELNDGGVDNDEVNVSVMNEDGLVSSKSGDSDNVSFNYDNALDITFEDYCHERPGLCKQLIKGIISKDYTYVMPHRRVSSFADP